MALDRQSIEKRDFPVGRRGYDPEAVDAHLSALATEIEEFKRSARQRTDTLASTTSERVRAIIEAAETSAAEIHRAAEEEAREIRDTAGNEVRAAREQAAAQAREHVERVAEATSAMLQRLASMEEEFGSLIESLRTGAGRLVAELRQLDSDLGRVAPAVPPARGETVLRAAAPATPPGDEVFAAGPAAGEHESALAMEETAETEPALPYHDGEGEAPEPAPEAPEPTPEAPEPAPEAAELDEVVGHPGSGSGPDVGPAPEPATSPAGDSDDAEGARLIALNMALNGTPREETARYLSENFTLADAAGLLDEVYASVEG